jgi:carbon-monoxide dehydrogenase small subunit
VLADLKAEPIAQRKAEAPAVEVHASAPMPSFTVAQQAPAVSAQPSAPAAESRKGWSHVEDSFIVDFPAQKVWDFMGDVEALASCLPGAEVLENDGRSVKGRIAIKFGPIAAAFNGSAVLERDDAARGGLLRGAGTDSISQSRAKGDVGYRVVAQDDGRTRVEITLDHMLQGALAQFSRSGLVRDFVTRMIADFGRNLAARMGGADAAELPVKSLGVSGAMLSIVWSRLKRLFGRQ